MKIGNYNSFVQQRLVERQRVKLVVPPKFVPLDVARQLEINETSQRCGGGRRVIRKRLSND